MPRAHVNAVYSPSGQVRARRHRGRYRHTLECGNRHHVAGRISPAGGLADIKWPCGARRLGNRWLVTLGVALIAVGDALLARAAAGSSVWLVAGLALIGIGAGAINGLLDNIAMSTIAPERSSMAAGIFQTMRVAGDAVAIAFGAMLASLTVAQATRRLAGSLGAARAATLGQQAAHGEADLSGLPRAARPRPRRTHGEPDGGLRAPSASPQFGRLYRCAARQCALAVQEIAEGLGRLSG
jgi:hypothetical protein